MKNMKKLLAEDAKRFQQILEYNFAIPTPQSLDEDDEMEGDDDGFPEPASEEDFENAETPDMGDEEASEPEAEEGPEMEPEEMPEPEGEINAPGMEDDAEEVSEPEAEPAGDEIELDVTELVDKSDEAVKSSEEANTKIDMLMAKLGELETKLPNVDLLAKQIQDLEKEIEERNPSEVEKLEMRSMNSYPYNLKLTDFWTEDDSNYEVENGEGQGFEKEEEEEEFVLTQDEVDSTYSDTEVKNTFDFEEEDI